MNKIDIIKQYIEIDNVLEASITGSSFFLGDRPETDILVVVKELHPPYQRVSHQEEDVLYDLIIVGEQFLKDTLEFKKITPMTLYNVFHLIKQPFYGGWDYQWDFHAFVPQYKHYITHYKGHIAQKRWNWVDLAHKFLNNPNYKIADEDIQRWLDEV